MIVSNPTSALELAAAASDPIDRAQSVGFLSKEWIKQDAAKAFEYIAVRTRDPMYEHIASSAIKQFLDVQDPAGSANRLGSLQSLSATAKEAIRTSVAGTLSAPQKALLLAIMK